MASRVLVPIALACAYATLMESAEPAQMRPPPGAAGRGAIIGRVVDTGGTPIPRAEVVLSRGEGWGTDPNRPLFLSVVADEDGEFAFTDLPAGHFSLRVTKVGYLEYPYRYRNTESDREALVLNSDTERKLDILIRLSKLASVTGLVTDEGGEPIPDVYVRAFKKVIVSGRPRFDSVPAASRASDDRGQYWIGNLEPGEYVFVFPGGPTIRLAAGDSRNPRVETFASPPSVMPPPSSDGEIKLLSLREGQDLTGIDFRVVLTPASRVSGRVSAVTAGETVTVRLQPQWNGMAASLAQSVGQGARPDGTFVLEGIIAGTYTLLVTTRDSSRDALPLGGGQSVIQTATGTMTSWVNLTDKPAPPPPMPASPAMSASMSLTVGAMDSGPLSVVLQPGPIVTGRLEFDGARQPPPINQLNGSIRIESADGTTVGMDMRPRVVLDANRRFAVADIAPGRYVVRASGIGWALRRVLADGRDISLVPVEWHSGQKIDLVLEFTDRLASIRGFVTGGTLGQSSDVLYFPADPRMWVDYGQSSDRIETRRAGRDGNFDIYLPAGDYFFLATSSDPGPNWRDADNLRRLSTVADRVTLNEGDRLTVNLPAVTLPRR